MWKYIDFLSGRNPNKSFYYINTSVLLGFLEPERREPREPEIHENHENHVNHEPREPREPGVLSIQQKHRFKFSEFSLVEWNASDRLLEFEVTCSATQGMLGETVVFESGGLFENFRRLRTFARKFFTIDLFSETFTT